MRKKTGMKLTILLFLGGLFTMNTACEKTEDTVSITSNRDITTTRIPGEWEEQAAIWMQWPNDWEADLRLSFVKIIAVVQQYEAVHLFVRDDKMKTQAIRLFEDERITLINVNFHKAAYDNAWLRDNGPVYVFDKTGKWNLDFGFNGWGSGFDKNGDVEYENDDAIPGKITSLLGCAYEDNNAYILERGNLEANGKDMVMLNWDCQSDRNADWTKERTEAYFREKFGITTVIWAHGHDPYDGTTGHIDGTARFVNESTVAIASIDPAIESYTGEAKNLDKLAAEARSAGLNVVRMPIPGSVKYEGEELPAMYMNYLVGNGFVLGMAFGNNEWDNAAKAQLQSLYPARTVHMIEVNALWRSGGGIHCVTNDEPLFE